MVIKKKSADGLDLVTIEHGGVSEHIINAAVCKNEIAPAFSEFPHAGEHVLNQFIFGGTKYHLPVMDAMPSMNWPLTWVHGDGCSGEDIAGCQAYVISGVDARAIVLDGQTVGYTYSDADAHYCWLGGILPGDVDASRPDQAHSVFERLEQALAQADMEFTDIARTWLFLEDLLDWYDDFNVVRTAFFEKKGIFDCRVPASTGIGAANQAAAALVASALAVKPLHQGVTITPQPSPLQCPALEYRSSFSRAMEIKFPDRRHLYISGTASIDAAGKSRHLGDIDKQIDLTMKVVDALLDSRKMTWSHVVRAIAYFKDIAEVPRYTSYLTQKKIPAFPTAYSHAAVCRDDLLFEIELDAVTAQ